MLVCETIAAILGTWRTRSRGESGRSRSTRAGQPDQSVLSSSSRLDVCMADAQLKCEVLHHSGFSFSLYLPRGAANRPVRRLLRDIARYHYVKWRICQVQGRGRATLLHASPRRGTGARQCSTPGGRDGVRRCGVSADFVVSQTDPRVSLTCALKVTRPGHRDVMTHERSNQAHASPGCHLPFVLISALEHRCRSAAL